jgi:ribosome-associated protein
MDIRKLQRAIVDGLEDVKAQNIVVFNTEHLSPLFERVIVASGTSNRQTKALASSVRETVKARGLPVLSTEGADNGEWIIVDCGAAVAHIMQPAIRDYYRLEEIWGGKAVKLKLDGKAAGLPKAESVRADEPAAGRPARAASARQGDAPTDASKKKPAATARKPASARRPGAGSPAAPRRSQGSHGSARKAAPAKAPAKAAPRKAASRKAAPRKTAPRTR